MWRSKLRQLLSRPPDFLTTSESETSFGGKYLQLDWEPYAVGKQIGEGDEAQVFELLSLRRGYFDRVVKICKHKIGSPAYEKWARRVRDEVNPHSVLPEIETLPARLIELDSGGVIKIQQYVSPAPSVDWKSSFPARPIVELLHRGQLSAAEKLCQQLIRQHGEKAIFLEQLALISVIGEDFEAARQLYEKCVTAHRAEGNSAILGALYNLALVLVRLYETRARPNELRVDLGNGIVHGQQIFEIDPVNPQTPVDLSDVALEVLVEALAVEPYFAQALALTCSVIGGGYEAESFLLAGEALTAIDPYHPTALNIRKQLDELQTHRNGLERKDEQVSEIPAHVRELMAKLDRTYEPPAPDEAQEAESLYLAALAHESRRDYARAKRDLTRAYALAPHDAKYILELIEMYCSQGDWETARDEIALVVKAFTDDWRGYELQGRINSELGDSRAACVAFHKALACNPPDPWNVMARLGMSYSHLGRMDEARHYVEEAYENSSKDWLVNLYLLQVLKKLALDYSDKNDEGESHLVLERAAAVLKSAEEHRIMNAPLFFAKAQLLILRFCPEESLAALEEGLKLDPSDLQAQEMYTYLKTDLEDGFFKSFKGRGNQTATD